MKLADWLNVIRTFTALLKAILWPLIVLVIFFKIAGPLRDMVKNASEGGSVAW
jgi:hypothetical protein